MFAFLSCELKHETIQQLALEGIWEGILNLMMFTTRPVQTSVLSRVQSQLYCKAQPSLLILLIERVERSCCKTANKYS